MQSMKATTLYPNSKHAVPARNLKSFVLGLGQQVAARDSQLTFFSINHMDLADLLLPSCSNPKRCRKLLPGATTKWAPASWGFQANVGAHVGHIFASSKRPQDPKTCWQRTGSRSISNLAIQHSYIFQRTNKKQPTKLNQQPTSPQPATAQQ